MNLPIILDIEASGFGKHGYPIEVGFISETSETWCSLIQPENDWQFWDFDAENVHHITREILIEHGKPVRLIAEQLNCKLKHKTVYTDGWAHDYVWMARLFESANMAPNFKLQDLRYVLNMHQTATWHTTKNTIIKELNAKRHRASTDAKILQLTWSRCLNLPADTMLA